jgi:hypothetical protein
MAVSRERRYHVVRDKIKNARIVTHLLLYFALKGIGVQEQCKHKTGRSNARIKMVSLVRRIHNICRETVCEMNEI